MDLIIQRHTYTDITTQGSLYIRRHWFCYTLEDRWRNLRSPADKVPGKTAIPAGKYRLVLNYSPRFKEIMPLILPVPYFTGIRIHWGNLETDTEGCQLVGYTLREDFVGNSKAAYRKLVRRLVDSGQDDHTIEVLDLPARVVQMMEGATT